jgi:DNA helicase-2/ATP-dependent DNA helicase PcrA
MPARSSWGSGWGNGWSGGGQVQTRSHGPSHNFGLNERIFHDKFGYGVITAIDGDTLTIDFALSDSKKVMAAYVRPVQKGE